MFFYLFKLQMTNTEYSLCICGMFCVFLVGINAKYGWFHEKYITNCVKILWLHFLNDNVIGEIYCIMHSLMVLLCCLDNPSVLCLSVLASIFPKVRELDKEGEQSCQQLNFYHSGLLYAWTDVRKTRLYFWVTPLRWGWLMRHCQKARKQRRHCDIFITLWQSCHASCKLSMKLIGQGCSSHTVR